MFKFFGGVVVGVFVGALTVEVISRTHPRVLNELERKARGAADRLNDLLHSRETFVGRGRRS